MSSINNETDRGFKSNFRIVIVGAGLVGLALAALLQKQGFQTIVLEQDESLKEVKSCATGRGAKADHSSRSEQASLYL